MKEHDYTSNYNAVSNQQLILDALDPLIATTSITGSNTSKEYEISSSYESYQQSGYKQSNGENMLPNMHYYCGDYVDMDIMNEISKELLDSDIISTMNNHIDITSRNNMKTTNKLDIKSNTKQNKKAKRKKLKKKNKQCMNDGIGYDPNPSFRAKGHIKISKELTQEIIPSRIKEQISNIYGWMDKWSALINNACTEYMEGKIRILNYGFHDKNNMELYHGVNAKMILNPAETLAFYGPLSTSSSYHIDRTFATAKGIVLQISSQYPRIGVCRGFNAALISDYPEEKEWVIGFTYLPIPLNKNWKTFDDIDKEDNYYKIPLSSKLHLLRDRLFSMCVPLEYWLSSWLYLKCKYNETDANKDNGHIKKTKIKEK